MAWLLGHRGDPVQSARIHAALARNIEVQERAAQAADDVSEAASLSRQRTEATRAEIRETIKHRSQAPKPTTSVRTMVEDMLQHLDDQEPSKREGGS